MVGIIVVDLETSGLYPQQHEILEIAWVQADLLGNEQARWSAKTLPTRPVDPRAAAVNGYTPEGWKAAGPLQPELERLSAASPGRVLVAHNVTFDWGFLEASGLKWRGDYHKACTMAMAFPLLARGVVQKVSLAALADHFGVVNPDQHRALGDALTCLEIYKRLVQR